MESSVKALLKYLVDLSIIYSLGSFQSSKWSKMSSLPSLIFAVRCYLDAAKHRKSTRLRRWYYLHCRNHHEVSNQLHRQSAWVVSVLCSHICATNGNVTESAPQAESKRMELVPSAPRSCLYHLAAALWLTTCPPSASVLCPITLVFKCTRQIIISLTPFVLPTTCVLPGHRGHIPHSKADTNKKQCCPGENSNGEEGRVLCWWLELEGDGPTGLEWDWSGSPAPTEQQRSRGCQQDQRAAMNRQEAEWGQQPTSSVTEEGSSLHS